jgi:hypothetical protein
MTTLDRNFPTAGSSFALCRAVARAARLLVLKLDAVCEKVFMPPGSVSVRETDTF